MQAHSLPGHNWLIKRWRRERAVALCKPALQGFSLVLLVLLGILWLAPASMPLLIAVLLTATLAAAGAIGVIAWGAMRDPTPERLAKRADHVLGLPDDLLALGEIDAASPEWEKAIRHQIESRMETADPAESWKVPIPTGTRWHGGLAGALAVLLIATAAFSWAAESDRLAVLDSEREERIAAAEDILEDWETFVELTEDEGLKQLIAEALKLREALDDRDPMAAMLEMNEIEQRMESLQAALDRESMANQAAALAEAFEAFEGMGAMSAALRNQNFSDAAAEADKMAEELADSKENSVLSRQEAVSEMLSNQASSAAKRGNQSLADALQELSDLAKESKNGKVENKQLASPMKQMAKQFSQECARQNQGRMVSLSKKQLEELRRRLREGRESGEPCPSLCAAAGLGEDAGQNAGTGTSDPMAEETQLAQAATTEALTGIMGEGESEITTQSAASGSGTATGGAQAVEFSEYAELSRQAVADENLPLAHRRVIRTYFERIRPIAESTNP